MYSSPTPFFMRTALHTISHPHFRYYLIMKLRNFFLYISTVLVLLALPACIEDSITTNPSQQPTFSVDTLHMGQVFTLDATPTHKFMVYNRHSKVLSISSIQFANGGTGFFRLNVDGMAGTSFNNIEIRPNDSIYVFVEATLPPNNAHAPVAVCETVEFITNGVTQSVVLEAFGRDVKRLKAHTITSDTTVTSALPLQIFDSLVVAPGVTLTLAPGAQLFFHDSASLHVHGSLVANGSPQAPVILGGDRSGWVATNIPYQIMSMQWDGVYFSPSSHSNSLSHTVIENTENGVTLDSVAAGNEAVPALSLVNCRLRNSGNHVLHAIHSSVNAVGCEFAEAGAGMVRLRGANHNFANCTFANHYLFSYVSGPIIAFEHADAESDDHSGTPFLSAEIANSIIYGAGGELSHSDLKGTNIFLRRCLLHSSGTDDDNFIDIIWGEEPLWLTNRENYYFNYQLLPESPAVGASFPNAGASAILSLPPTDFYGNPHPSPASVGAMEVAQ